jgi:hypothetical protein
VTLLEVTDNPRDFSFLIEDKNDQWNVQSGLLIRFPSKNNLPREKDL